MMIQTLATEVLQYMDTRTHTMDKKPLITVREAAPAWIHDLIQRAHGGMLPNDWRYAAIKTILEHIEDADDPDDALENWEPDIYDRDLVDWLRSYGSRKQYVDDAVKEYGWTYLMEALQLGQRFEMEEIFDMVITGLQARKSELTNEG